jgi:hypothetical protein
MPVTEQLDTTHPSRQVNDSEGIFQQCDSDHREVSRRVLFGAERRNVTRSVVTVRRIECNSNYCSYLISAAAARGGGVGARASHDHAAVCECLQLTESTVQSGWS